MNLMRFVRREEEPVSKEVAKERLQMVLMHDRVNVSPKLLVLVKSDIARVISSYMQIDAEGFEVKLNRGEGENAGVSALEIHIPIQKIKDIGKNSY